MVPCGLWVPYFVAEWTIERGGTVYGTAHIKSASCPKQKLPRLDHAALEVVMVEDKSSCEEDTTW